MPRQEPAGPSGKRRPRKELLGCWEHLGVILPSDADWAAMDKEIEAEFHGDVLTSEKASA